MKPCPFCGGIAELTDSWVNDGEGGQIETVLILCNGCPAQMQSDKSAAESLRLMWDKRS